MKIGFWKHSFVSGVALFGVAAGALVGASGVAVAAPPVSTVTATEVAPQSVENLGLTVRQAKAVQHRHREFGYDPGAIDGYLGTSSWKAIQQAFRDQGVYTGPIDGIVGPETIKALQRSSKSHWGYTGAIDGIAGEGTRAAWARYADYCVDLYGY
ncbi:MULTISPECIES: peptidoglycan-binding domain-containing protein [Streptomyces diastaticus group]|uniref:Peptidoglycan binding-like domain-containing protein n=2 Tax=Streptomyces diastaticus group TaxID=2849069 RepID=A0A8H9LX41_9ACTN|nr:MULTISPECIES: peptidoglycan-binding domain-containing protein [Streptomyces diastaticus group]QNE85113.1 peptidoglycan-binding protein [Streptomyces rutgersensis]GFH81531.1 hypothetical protein Sgou_62010 [Streptomyces gougerotii]GGU92014.1 hypothetical protein GCM10010227_54160 [Streptomyces gougerotii]